MKTRNYIKTSILVTIVLFFTVQKGYGPLVLSLWFIFLFVLIYNLIRMARKPDERKRRGIRMAIWLVALSVAGAVQSHWASSTSKEADKVAKLVHDYQAHKGVYPANLAEAGLDEKALENDWDIRYFLREGKPVLAYPATFMPLTTYDYDFDKHTWKENSY
jgi:hypothetical protein